MKLFIIFSCLTVVCAKSLFQDIESDSSNVCLSSECTKAAAEILEKIDESIDPCEDFYHFACGGWIKTHPIPENKAEISFTSGVAEELTLELRELMEKPLKETEPDFVRLLKTTYDTCMDTRSIEKAGGDPLKKYLTIFGGWPVVEGYEWNESSFDWIETLIRFSKYGYSHSYIISFGLSPDLKNGDSYVLQMHQGTLGLPDRSYYLNGLEDKVTAAYFEIMIKAANKLGADETKSRDELLKALNFETALANFSLSREESRDIAKQYNEYTMASLNDITSEINWQKFVNGIFGASIPEDERIIVGSPEYMVKLANLISKTDKRVIANYLMWRIVRGSMHLLSQEWRDLDQEFDAVMYGQKEENPRWMYCIGIVSSDFETAMSNYYVSNYFTEETKQAAEQLVSYIKQEFRRIIANVEWMDPKTKEDAIQKAQNLGSLVGYPAELLNNSLVSKEYKKLTLTEDDFFVNKRQINRWALEETLAEYHKPYVKNSWRMHTEVAVVNAFYSMLENTMIIPVGILKDKIFHKDRPNYLNFGSIGSIIGHEITHGFDDTGRQFDKEGNYVNWWDTKTYELYEKKVGCIINQYSEYDVNGIKINGIITQGENIADNGGVKESYLAYESWIKDNGEESLLPGLDYTPKQMLWITAAHMWCENVRPEAMKLQILTASHTPSQFRVIGPMSNRPEFARDFNCPINSPMNPEKKCQVW